MPTQDIVSDLSVMNRLDEAADFDALEYALTMRQISTGELGTPVSAFNSSI